jgi:glycosyltransferase involved in cell wall biosynthesis
MNILLVRSTGFPPDLRIEKEARSLLKAGHKVHLLCSGKRGEPREDSWGKMYIHRLVDNNFLLTMIINLLYYVFRINFRFTFHTRKLIKKYQIEAVCIYNTPYVPSVWLATKRPKIPLILVVLEYWPASLNSIRLGFWDRIKEPIFMAKFIDNLGSRLVDFVVVMAEELKELVIQYGVPSSKIEVVTNAWELETEISIDKKLEKKYEDRFVVSYIGLVNAPHRGVDVAIRAMTYIVKRVPEALLLIVGYGNLLEEMKRLAKDLKVDSQVVFTGKVAFQQVPTYISLSQACLVPVRIDKHTDTTLMHKFFQYMALGKPVVSTRTRTMARVIEETQCGYIVPSEDPVALSDAVIDLYKNKEKALEMGRNGARWVKEKYNWESEFIKLNKIYLSLRRSDS